MSIPKFLKFLQILQKSSDFVAFKEHICYTFCMKILVVSDTHGSVGPILTAIDREKPDVIIHLGNDVNDLKDINFKGQIYGVKGPFDFNKKLRTMAKVFYDKTAILYLNGHEFHVNQGYNELVSFATQHGANIVLFGHTGKADYFEREGIIFVNPGSMKKRSEATYVTIELKRAQSPIIMHHDLMKE